MDVFFVQGPGLFRRNRYLLLCFLCRVLFVHFVTQIFLYGRFKHGRGIFGRTMLQGGVRVLGGGPRVGPIFTGFLVKGLDFIKDIRGRLTICQGDTTVHHFGRIRAAGRNYFSTTQKASCQGRLTLFG